MGNFDSVVVSNLPTGIPRSVLKNTVGPKSNNVAQDLHVIAQTLSSAGLLHENASASSTHEAIFRAIHHAQKALGDIPADTHAAKINVYPGDNTELALRRAVSNGRLPLSHRAISQSTAPKEPKEVISGGMKRALAKLNEQHNHNDLSSPLRRALLPVISAQTFQSNRRLAEALIENGHFQGLETLIATTLQENGKQGFSDVRDFFAVLKDRSPAMAVELRQDVRQLLDGKRKCLLRKLYLGQPPIEGDFD